MLGFCGLLHDGGQPTRWLLGLEWCPCLSFSNPGGFMSSVGYHEPIEELSPKTRDMHRAIVSLMEELEAVDWYNQRADACQDPELKAILEHNRDEEKEHAAMVLEWIRRQDPKFSAEMKDYLFTDKPIAHK
jgi:uncharacterized protein